MREKELKIVIAFGTTTEAMAAEKKCAEEGMPGRLIPLPSSISAGCGLAFMAPVLYKEELLLFLETRKLNYRSATEIFL
ncbi:MAG TPA: DUF3343 domain-containing protein [Lachnospiraceae bacterium]|nr:DUF3343 domain-containing protein [Lachnospiraceae bacterium]